jgi:hypothetical protein
MISLRIETFQMQEQFPYGSWLMEAHPANHGLLHFTTSRHLWVHLRGLIQGKHEAWRAGALMRVSEDLSELVVTLTSVVAT